MGRESAAGRVEIEVPPGFRRVENQGKYDVLTFRSEAPPATLKVVALPPAPLPPLDLALDIARRSGVLEVRESRAFCHPTLAPAAHAKLLFDDGAEWVTWVRCTEGFLVVSLVSPPDRIEALADAFERTASTLAPHRAFHEPLGEEVARRMAARWPHLSFRVAADGADVEVSAPDGRRLATAGLTSLARRIAAEPLGREGLIEEHLAALPVDRSVDLAAGGGELPAPTPEGLYPRLVPDGYLADLPPASRPARREFPGGLSIVLVHADPGLGDRYLTGRDLAGLGLSFGDALARACENLGARLAQEPLQALADEQGRPQAFVVDDPRAAAAILLPRFRRVIADALGSTFLACVPAPDELVAFRSEPAAAAQRYIEIARRSHAAAAHPVSDRVFRATAGGVELAPG